MTTYNGNDIFYPFNAGLYGIDDDFDFDKSIQSIMNGFIAEYQKQITDTLHKSGLKFVSLKWFFPKEYNYMTDSIDLTIELVDREKFNKSVDLRKEKIMQELSDNKSYDGYMSLTAYSFEEAKEKMDIACIKELLSDIPFNEFILTDYLVME